jgi:hypothetical protein
VNENGEVIDSPTVNAAVVGVEYTPPAETETEPEPEPEPEPQPESQPEPQSAAQG